MFQCCSNGKTTVLGSKLPINCKAEGKNASGEGFILDPIFALQNKSTYSHPSWAYTVSWGWLYATAGSRTEHTCISKPKYQKPKKYNKIKYIIQTNKINCLAFLWDNPSILAKPVSQSYSTQKQKFKFLVGQWTIKLGQTEWRTAVQLCGYENQTLQAFVTASHLNTKVLIFWLLCMHIFLWDSCGKGCKAYLDKLHRRGACIIEGRPVNPTELHTVFGWPNLQMRRDYLKCILVYKSLHAMAPAYLLTEFRHAHQIHTYNTRHRDLLRLPIAKTVKYQGSFRYNGARTFNALPLN